MKPARIHGCLGLGLALAYLDAAQAFWAGGLLPRAPAARSQHAGDRPGAICGSSVAGAGALRLSSASVWTDETGTDYGLARGEDGWGEYVVPRTDVHISAGSFSFTEAQREIHSVTASPQTDLSSLLEVVERHCDRLNPENCGAILNRLSKLCAAESQVASLILDSRFQALMHTVDANDVGWTPKACALTINALSRLEIHASTFLLHRVRDQLLHHARSSPDILQPRHFSLILNGFARQQFDPGEVFFRQVLDTVRERLNSFPTRELATLVHALGRLSATFSPPPWLLPKLESVLLTRLPEAQSQDLANAIYGLSKLGHVPSTRFLQHFEQVVLSKDQLLAFKPLEIAMTAQGLGTVGHRPSAAFLRSLVDATASRLMSFSPQEMVTSMKGLSRLGYRPTDEMEWNLWSEAVQRCMGDFKPQELATLIKACTHMQVSIMRSGGGQELSAAVQGLVLTALQYARPRFDEFKGSELACIVHSLGASQCFPPEDLMVALVAQMEAKLLTCDTQSLANLLAGLGRLGLYPGDSLARGLDEKLMALLPELNARDLSDMVAGWAQLGQHPGAGVLNLVVKRVASLISTYKTEGLVRVFRSLAVLVQQDDAATVEEGAAVPMQVTTVELVGAVEEKVAELPAGEAARVLVALSSSLSDTEQQQKLCRILAKRVEQQLSMSTADLALVTWAWGKLPPAAGIDGVEVLAVLEGRAEATVGNMKAAELVKMVTAFIRLHHQPGDMFMSALRETLERRLQDREYDDDREELFYHLASLMNALVTLHAPTAPALQDAFVDRLRWKMRQGTTTHDLAAGVNALARMGSVSSSAFFEDLDRALWEHTAEGGAWEPSACVLLVAGLAQLGHRPPPDTLGRLTDIIATKLDDFETEGLVSLLEGMGRLAYFPGAGFMASYLNCMEGRMRATGEAMIKADSLVKVTRALISLRYHPGKAFLEALEDSLMPLIAVGKRLAWACMALATFTHQPSKTFLIRLEATIRGRAATLSLAQISAILWGLAVVGLSPRSSLFAVLVAAASHHMSTTVSFEDNDDDDGAASDLEGEECSLDGLSIHRRLREAGAYIMEGKGPDVDDARRFLALTSKYWERCHDTWFTPPTEAEESLRLRVIKDLESQGYRQFSAAESDGQNTRTFAPDVVAIKDGHTIEVVVLQQHQVFVGADGSSHIPVGGSGFRMRMLKRGTAGGVSGRTQVVGVYLAGDTLGFLSMNMQ